MELDSINQAAPRVRTSVLDAIGNTPVVQLRKLTDRNSADVVLKLEWYNPTGSYKDRMAVAMIEGAEERGALRPGMRVVEYTGGSTGSSLAMVCAVKGYRFTAVSSDAWAREKLETMRALGAEVITLRSDGGRVTPELFPRLRAEVDRLIAEGNAFWSDQFHNEDALNGYRKIGDELVAQTGGAISVFCGAVGTGGMLVGVSQALKAGGCQARIFALEPAESPALTAGRGGAHRVEGIGVGYVPSHLEPGTYHEARAIPEAEARATARRLAREEGILAGTSTGLNVAAALQLARELGPGHVVATVAVDTGLKYLAGDLFASTA
jgi:cysteine synthase